MIVETHTDPSTAYSDADQTISVEMLRGLIRDVEVLSGLENLFEPKSETAVV